MAWKMIVTMVWVVNGQPTAPYYGTELSFQSKELCETAVSALVAEMSEPVSGDVKVYAHAVCVQRK